MAGQDNPSGSEHIQSEGREENAAQPLNQARGNAGAERYPEGEAGDDGEPRSFSPGNPRPRQGAGDGGPAPSANEGRLGPGGDPVEGKR